MAACSDVTARDQAAVSADLFRQSMRLLPGAVSVVTVRHGAELTGFTATSVSSFSADPPTLLLCINRNSSSFPTLEGARSMTVNVLAAGQDDIADRFAGRHGQVGAERFTSATWLDGANPHLAGALLCFDCVIEEMIPRHSHAIVLGRVVGVATGDPSSALLYWQGQYERLGWTAAELSNAIGLCSEQWPIVRAACSAR